MGAILAGKAPSILVDFCIFLLALRTTRAQTAAAAASCSVDEQLNSEVRALQGVVMEFRVARTTSY